MPHRLKKNPNYEDGEYFVKGHLLDENMFAINPCSDKRFN
jgi:hypothetical protein